MSPHGDARTSQRIPLGRPVQIVTKGRTAFYALAINIGIGGLLISAAGALPVGTRCGVMIPKMKNPRGEKVLVEGTVIRNDAGGVALRFANQLEGTAMAAMTTVPMPAAGSTLLRSYLDYFRVTQHPHFEGSQRLLGVSPGVFRKVFLTTFLGGIPLAIAPVWFARHALQPIPDVGKVLMSFGYAAIWFAVVQPLCDLAVFRYLRNHSPAP